MKQFDGPWFEKGDAVTLPIKTNITRGSLPTIGINDVADDICVTDLSIQGGQMPATIGALTTALMLDNTFLKEGDQLTFVGLAKNNVSVFSIILDSTSTEAVNLLSLDEEKLAFSYTVGLDGDTISACVILSREGESGQHLRSTTALTLSTAAAADTHYTSTAKEAAIESYMAANGNTDWPQEQI
ncbi:MAG: hypothetical protein IKE94_16460 [Aeriscardovia sp.]|nr:hypothetical protein [Aeriscardovia sp.]